MKKKAISSYIGRIISKSSIKKKKDFPENIRRIEKISRKFQENKEIKNIKEKII